MSEPRYMILCGMSPANFVNSEGNAGDIITVLNILPSKEHGLTNTQLLEAWVRNRVVAAIPAERALGSYVIADLPDDHVPFVVGESTSVVEEDDFDPVSKPSHYNQLGVTPFDVIDALGLNYYTGNALKYLWRHQDKGTPIQDLEKAIVYLETEIENRRNE